MRFNDLEILVGNSLFVLKHIPLITVEDIASIWGMLSTKFPLALKASGSQLIHTGFSGPRWMTSDKLLERLKQTLLKRRLVKEVVVVVEGKSVKRLTNTSNGNKHLEIFARRGMKFPEGDVLQKIT